MGKRKKLHVTVKPWKLEGLPVVPVEESEKNKLVMIEVKWKGPVSGLVPFYRPSRLRNFTSQKPMGECHVEWEEEFGHVCCFVGPWDLSFKVLYGESVESNDRLVVMGKVSLDLAELASKMESTVERKLPVALKASGIAKEATLVVSVSFAEVRNVLDSARPGRNPTESESLLKKMKGSSGSRKKAKLQPDQLSGSDESPPVTDPSLSRGTDSGSSGGELSSGTESGAPSSPDTRSDPVGKNGFFSWKRRRLSFSLSRRREPLVENNNGGSDGNVPGVGPQEHDEVELSLEQSKQEDTEETEDPVVRELVSRDRRTKLKSEVFLASLDQRSEKVGGESACTAVVVVIAHWLHTNPRLTPSKPEFDSLITQGSSLWQDLCADESYTNSFPDKHFDLETVIKANLRPVRVCMEKSFTGFFSPEKFESLKGLVSFDDMWEEIKKNPGEGRVYIVSWNDHFFVLKVEADEYYIIDSLGERLYEGCKQAYILKFDDSSLMYEKKVRDRPTETDGEKEPSPKEEEESEEIVICSGKECCREYIKRFLASIPVAELEEEEKKGKASTFSLHQRLQIDMHYTLLE